MKHIYITRKLYRIITFCVFIIYAFNSIANKIPGSPTILPNFDLETATNYCDTAPLNHIEGIWEFTEDEITVCIKQNDFDNISDYIMIIVETNNATTEPGQILGYIDSTSDFRKYKMFIYSDIANGIICRPIECAATISDDKHSISFQSESIKLKFNVFGLLPYFWRTIRFSKSSPAESLPKGFIKTYPSYDGNGSSLYNPRYL